jgi:predicted ATPase/serine phosphatase RsbU (regulator of sigma subunit)/tRNA A-37 threonylcarbamoyl transferase component Bud32
MKTISPYVLDEKIHESRNSLVYRGHKENESKNVIIKVLRTQYPTPSELARFRQEYRLIKNLTIDGIIKTYDLVEDADRYAIIEEDFDGISLKKFIKTKKPDVTSFLHTAIKISETLGILHKNNIIHLDIKPDNILVNEKSGAVKITDFGISAALTHANDEIYNPDVIEGTLAYMSPEQTGRMNRTVDYRTDLYSLGITFYEMLTGEVPFKSKDPMELIHSHIARQPTPPRELNPSTPPVISAIIMKLLSKTPEERYQNSLGLAADINECLNQLTQNNKIGMFPLATKDISTKFNIPQTLIGRSGEIEELMQSFERIDSGRCEIMLVTGNPGIGKSALINEIRKPIIAKKGFFISGKYDQFRRDVPYSSIIQAFQWLVKQILVQSDENLRMYKERLINALGNIGKVITDVIPQVELIVGKQPDIPGLGPEETQNRFNLVLRNFTNVFATKESPLVLLLDDLQWADPASLQLIKTIVTQRENIFLLFLGAYRDNEVSQSHPLIITLDEIRKKGVPINTIHLQPLKPEDVNALTANALRRDAKMTIPLGRLIYDKTNGNPFFVNQFLKTLYDERMIEYDSRSGWKWDIEKITQMQVTDNVVELMAGKISKLPENTRKMLKICACIGNRFDLAMISLVSGTSIEKTLEYLTVAIEEGLVGLHGDNYRFHHDRIQEAAYSLIPEEEKAKMHYRIGRNVLATTSNENLFEMIFYIVDQLNNGRTLIRDQIDRTELARLNRMAGVKAKKSTAYGSAVRYLIMGIELLPEQSWEADYELTYSLFRERMECEYLTGNFEVAVSLFDIVTQNSKTVVDRANAYGIMVILYTNIGNYKEAIKFGLEGLDMVGHHLPKKPGKIHVLLGLIRLRLNFGNRKIEDIVNLPIDTDPERIAIGDLSFGTGTAAYYVDTNLFTIIVIKLTTMFLKYGNIESAPPGWIAISPIIGSVLGHYNESYRFARAAMNLNEKNITLKFNCKVNYLFAYFSLHWTRHAREDMQYFREAYRYGLESGDLIFCGYSITCLFAYRVMMGNNLDDIFTEYRKYENFQLSVKDPLVAGIFRENMWLYLNLKGLTETRSILNYGEYDEENEIKKYREANNFLCVFLHLLARIRIQYLAGNYFECVEIAVEMEKIIVVVIGSLFVPEFYFYYSLALAAKYKSVSAARKLEYRIKLAHNQKKMRTWAKFCPENFLHKYLLVKAETARCRGKHKTAVSLYDQAIKSARDNQYTQNEAIASELAALFMRETGNVNGAQEYMKQAHYGYIRWGATSKANDLMEKYSDIIGETAKKAADIDKTIDTDSTTLKTGAAGIQTLDLTTVIKTSQTLSGEIDLRRLLSTIMKLSIENAGAQHGYLILENDADKKLYIEAAGQTDETVEVLKSIPFDDNDSLSEGIVNYVHKTGENIVLNDAASDQRFIKDPYIIANRPKSILCTPIRHKGAMSGILYLENNLTTNAFTPERLALLQILSAQAAISIENSRLILQRETAAKLETEMNIAAGIQSSLLPDNPAIDGYEITAYMKPADDIGGDYYDIINRGPNNWVIIGDVSGHGVPAGLVMMMVQSSIQTLVRKNPEIKPSDLLSTVNEMITYNVNKMKEQKYMTITAFSFGKDGRAIYSGLHQDILVYRKSSENIEIIPSEGLWLSPWDLGRENIDKKLYLKKGDTLLLYTDGITEAMDSGDKFFSQDRLLGIFKKYGNLKTDVIRDEILEALKGYALKDDVTMVLMKKN